ncbi:methyl-accepting chemotaxis protein [Rhodopseudomonas pseudopalustris]|uniref:methyl-accepting chemotaxis protein n=1 Tax=Rhodopseudomonas pseudopalustris TaxID=1513892 RepID=UPI003F94B435
MFGWVKNIGLPWKVQMAPAVLIVALIGVGVYTLQNLKHNMADAEALINGPIQQAQLVAELDSTLWKAHAKLYRLAALAANETDDKKIKAGMSDATAASAKIPAALQAIEAAADPGTVKPALLAKLKTAVAGYIKQSKSAIEMADGDPGSAMLFIRNAERHFNEIDQLTDEVSVLSGESRDQAIARSNIKLSEQQSVLLALLIVVAVLGVLVSFVVGRDISRPVVAMARAMRELATGNFDVRLPGLGRRDEVGQMAKAVEEFKVQAQAKAERDVAEREQKSREAAQARRAELHQLADNFQAAVGKIIETVGSASSELEHSAKLLANSSDATQKLSTMVTSASEETSGNVQTVADATEQVAASVNEIGTQVQLSAKITLEAVEQTEKTDARIAKLADAANRIGDVTEIIAKIAAQTNLLALNATIESARAGEAGRGFAVVAQEVKALASQTSQATSEISSQIAGIQAETQESVRAIKEIGDTIRRVAGIAERISGAIETQGGATRDIAVNVQQAAIGTSQVANNIGDVSRGATEIGAASTQVLTSAQLLSRENQRLSEEVNKFLHTVRVA